MNSVSRLVFVGTKDCKPCREAKQHIAGFLAAADQNIEAEFIDITVENLDRIVTSYEIASLPTIIFFDSENQPIRYPENFEDQRLSDFLDAARHPSP